MLRSPPCPTPARNQRRRIAAVPLTFLSQTRAMEHGKWAYDSTAKRPATNDFTMGISVRNRRIFPRIPPTMGTSLLFGALDGFWWQHVVSQCVQLSAKSKVVPTETLPFIELLRGKADQKKLAQPSSPPHDQTPHIDSM